MAANVVKGGLIGRAARATIRAMSIDELLAHNHAFVEANSAPDLPARPRRGLAIVSCMDARIDLVRGFGLRPGDAHIIRNAGGRMADAVRSLVVSQTQLGTREVAIIHHTQCGMMTFRDDDLRAQLRSELGVDASHVAFLPFADLEQSVRDDIDFYRREPLLRQDIPVRGLIYEVESGLLREVLARQPAGAAIPA